MKDRQIALIVGAGPAGLTAAYELLAKTDIKPIIFEQSGEIGGISRTINYKGNRIDIGGHRFFSKDSRIVNWWTNILPMQSPRTHDPSEAPDPDQNSACFLLRQRLSRIYFLRRFFDYPIRFNMNTIRNLGVYRILKIGFSYIVSVFTPINIEKSLEDFFINRFGRELFLTFFKDYTEKVWGVPCSSIKPEWGAQRIKGLSVTKTIVHSLNWIFRIFRGDFAEHIETSLIEQFMYPKLGPGQLWEEVAAEIVKNGGELHLNSKVVGIRQKDGLIESATVREAGSGNERQIQGDFFFSSMPVRELIDAMETPTTHEVQRIASGLIYRDFLTVGLLVDELSIKNETKIHTRNKLIPDNWIYVQESAVKLGRIQIFNNWSPHMIQDSSKVWLGLEYFCQEGDSLWSTPDGEMILFAGRELAEIGIIDSSSIRDGIVIREPKAYPAYFGSYDEFAHVRQFTDSIANLFLIGRNGMHRYNNMDHSMMTAMVAVENVINGRTDKGNIWQINMDEGYHEER